MYRRGTIVVASDPFGETPRRPYLIVSDETHPFVGEQYIAIGISTKRYDESIPIADEIVEGALDRESFVAPWAVVSLRETNVERAVARVSKSVTETAVRRMAGFTGSCDLDVNFQRWTHTCSHRIPHGGFPSRLSDGLISLPYSSPIDSRSSTNAAISTSSIVRSGSRSGPGSKSTSRSASAVLTPAMYGPRSNAATTSRTVS